jgi:hypothetical protein
MVEADYRQPMGWGQQFPFSSRTLMWVNPMRLPSSPTRMVLRQNKAKEGLPRWQATRLSTKVRSGHGFILKVSASLGSAASAGMSLFPPPA